MPLKRAAIGRSTPQTRKQTRMRASKTDKQRNARLESARICTEAHVNEADVQREARLESD